MSSLFLRANMFVQIKSFWGFSSKLLPPPNLDLDTEVVGDFSNFITLFLFYSHIHIWKPANSCLSNITQYFAKAFDHSQCTVYFNPFPQLRLGRHIVCFELQYFYGQYFYWTFCHYRTKIFSFTICNISFLTICHPSMKPMTHTLGACKVSKPFPVKFWYKLLL